MAGQADPPEWDVPAPVLLNRWKHHAGFLRGRIDQAARRGEPALDELAAELRVVGNELMDLYTGPHPPRAIAEGIIDVLRAERLLPEAAYRAWVAKGGGYRVLGLRGDPSQWVLRAGNEPGRYVHVHPGRWTHATRRVRANVLKTAVMALAWTAVHGGDPADLAVVNAVRRRYLALAPLGKPPTGDLGLGALIDLLRPVAPP